MIKKIAGFNKYVYKYISFFVFAICLFGHLKLTNKAVGYNQVVAIIITINLIVVLFLTIKFIIEKEALIKAKKIENLETNLINVDEYMSTRCQFCYTALWLSVLVLYFFLFKY